MMPWDDDDAGKMGKRKDGLENPETLEREGIPDTGTRVRTVYSSTGIAWLDGKLGNQQPACMGLI